MANGENLCDEVRSLGKRQSGDRQTEWYSWPRQSSVGALACDLLF